MTEWLPRAPGEGANGSILEGIGCGVLVSVIAPVLLVIGALVFNTTWLAAIIFIGVTQLLWIVPLVVMFWRKGRYETAKGITIVAAIVFFINAACGVLI